MDDLRGLTYKTTVAANRIRTLVGQLTTVRAAIRTLNARTQRVTLDTGSLGNGPPTDMPIEWPTPWPDATYTVIFGIAGDSNTAGNLHATLKAGTKTTTGCTVTVKATGNADTTSIEVIGLRP
jgi:hypothetical protein